MGMWYISYGLYLGDKEGATNLKKLQAAKICHVVNAAGAKFDNYFHGESFSMDNIEYLNLRLLDREDAVLPLETVLEFTGTAKDKGGIVLIHCRGGLSRSCSLMAAHLMHHERMSLHESVALIERARGKQFINSGFLKQLRDFELSLHDDREPSTRQSSLAEKREIGYKEHQKTENQIISAANKAASTRRRKKIR